MTIIEASAPGGVSLVGEPSDLCGGSAIATSTAERAWCRITTDADVLTISSGDFKALLRTKQDLTLAGDAADPVRVVLAALDVDPARTRKFQLETGCDPVLQSGLGGGAAKIAAIFGALLELIDRTMHPFEMAEAVRDAERAASPGACAGYIDAYMAIFGGLRFIDFREKQAKSGDAALSPFATVEPMHEHVSYAPVVVAWMEKGEERDFTLRATKGSGGADARLEAACGVASELASHARSAKAAMLTGDWDNLALWMTRAQEIRSRIEPRDADAEKLIDAALSAGALAAKAAGGCCCGAAVALTLEPDRIAEAFTAAGATGIVYPKPTVGLVVRKID